MTQWRTGMKLTKARLDDGSSGTWTTGKPVQAEQLRDRLGLDVRAGDELTPENMNG